MGGPVPPFILPGIITAGYMASGNTMTPITRAEYWRLRKLISQHKLSYYRVIAWTAKAWGLDDLLKLTPPMLRTLEKKIPEWGQQVADERELAEERAAIQAPDLTTPLDMSGWIAEYELEELKQRKRA